VSCRLADGQYMGYYCDPSAIRGWQLPKEQPSPSRAAEAPADGPPPATTVKDPDQAVAFAFELLQGMDGLASEDDVQKHYQQISESWCPAAQYKGTESEIRTVVTKVLEEWASQANFGSFQIKRRRSPGGADILAFMVNDSGSVVSFYPVVIWKTPDHYFSYGNGRFKVEP